LVFYRWKGVLGVRNDIADLLRKGNEYLAAGHTHQAEKVFTDAVRIAHAHGDLKSEMEAGMGLGMSFFVEGEYERAKTQFGKTTEAIIITSYIETARMLIRGGDDAAALDWCHRARTSLRLYTERQSDDTFKKTAQHADALLDAAMLVLIESLRRKD